LKNTPKDNWGPAKQHFKNLIWISNNALATDRKKPRPLKSKVDQDIRGAGWQIIRLYGTAEALLYSRITAL